MRIAADESIRRADDPLRVAVAGAADGAVIKCTPLVGMRCSMHYLVPVFTGLGAWLLHDEPIGQQRLPA